MLQFSFNPIQFNFNHTASNHKNSRLNELCLPNDENIC